MQGVGIIMRNPFDFTNKKYMIVGATSGIGQSVAEALSKQGATLILVGRNESKLRELVERFGENNHKYFARDLSEQDSYDDIFKTAVQDGKKIDGLVYCAGIAKIMPVSAIDTVELNEIMTVNLYSFILFVRLFSKKKYHEKGSVVGISSISALYPNKCQSLYVASKAAMNAFVQSVAIELAEKNIRINTILPGNVRTSMLNEAINSMSEENSKKLIDRQVLGVSEPCQIADTIMWLLSDASSSVTGREIYSDGGSIRL